MKRSIRKLLRFSVLICLLFSGLTAAVSAAGNNSSPSGGSAPAAKPARTPWLLVGGRIGAAYEYAKPSEFNALIQPFFPSHNSYFPVYSILGVSLTESIAISNTGFRLALTQLPTVSGLDQNYAMPRLTLLVGVQTGFGLEGGVGAQLEPVVASKGSGVEVGPSLVYSVGWRFTFGKVSVPITLMADPLPPHRHPRASLMAGIDYGFAPSAPKRPKSPFNY